MLIIWGSEPAKLEGDNKPWSKKGTKCIFYGPAYPSKGNVTGSSIQTPVIVQGTCSPTTVDVQIITVVIDENEAKMRV